MRGEEHKFLRNYVIYIIIEIHLYLLYHVIFVFFFFCSFDKSSQISIFNSLCEFGNNFASLIIVYCI